MSRNLDWQGPQHEIRFHIAVFNLYTALVGLPFTEVLA